MHVKTRVLAVAGVTAVALMLGGCGSTPTEDMKDWHSSGGKERIQNLIDDADEVNGLSMSGIASLAPACKKLLTHVVEAEEYDPIPDEDAQEVWEETLASFKRGASDCTAGAKKEDSVRVSNGVIEIQTKSIRRLSSTIDMIKTALRAE
jgi:hypothetical protein